MGKSEPESLKEVWEDIEDQERADAKANSFLTFWHKSGALQNSLEKWLNFIKTSNVSQVEWNYVNILSVMKIKPWWVFFHSELYSIVWILTWGSESPDHGPTKLDSIVLNSHLFFLARLVVQHVSCWSGNTRSTDFPEESGYLAFHFFFFCQNLNMLNIVRKGVKKFLKRNSTKFLN